MKKLTNKRPPTTTSGPKLYFDNEGDGSPSNAENGSIYTEHSQGGTGSSTDVYVLVDRDNDTWEQIN